MLLKHNVYFAASASSKLYECGILPGISSTYACHPYPGSQGTIEIF